MRDVCRMSEVLHRLASGEVIRLPDPETEQLLSSVDHLTENVAHAAEPVAELRAWSVLLVALTDRLPDEPIPPASPRERVLQTMVGKAAGLASAALQQIVYLRCGHPAGDLLDDDL